MLLSDEINVAEISKERKRADETDNDNWQIQQPAKSNKPFVANIIISSFFFFAFFNCIDYYVVMFRKPFQTKRMEKKS